MIRKRQVSKEEDDSLLEIDSDLEDGGVRGKIFNKSFSSQQNLSKLQRFVLVTSILFILGLTYFLIAFGRKSPTYQTECVHFGKPINILPDTFTAVVLGHLTLRDEQLRATLRELSTHLIKNDRVVIGLRQIVQNRRKTLEHLVKEELKEFLLHGEIILCDKSGQSEAWRDLWKLNLVSSNFVIFDGLKMLRPGWREWLAEKRINYPDWIFSLQSTPKGGEDKLFRQEKMQVSQIPTYSALSPSPNIWNMFLNWFDAHPMEKSRLGFSPLPGDIEDGWQHRPLGHYSGWAKPFAQYVARYQHRIGYAYPPFATSLYQ